MDTSSSRRWRLIACMAAAAALTACGDSSDSPPPSPPPPPPAAAPTLTILSSSPDYVSGGSVLVDVALNTSTDTLGVTLNGTDVSSAFQADPAHAGHMLGVVKNVQDGSNALSATENGGDAATASFTGYPITGPIFSGPHQTPFICQTDTFALPDGSMFTAAPNSDPDCGAPGVVTYMYLQAGATALVPLPGGGVLPTDIASTTTVDGKTVPFVVRVETATVDRGIYQSAVLHDPTTEHDPSPVAPPVAWNHKLIAIEGFGCPGGWYIQGGAEGNLALAGFDFSLLSVARLGEGYATFANTLQHASNDCNAVLESEAAMMSKEYFTKIYGVPTFTVSAGCSGGSYGSSQPADRIPGLFDGIMILCTFPDPLGIAFSGSDGHLLTHYMMTVNPTEFTIPQQIAVSGYKTSTAADPRQAWIDAANQSGRTDPVPGRVDIPGYASATWNPVVPVDLRYDPVTNPTGARPTIYDADKNIYGVDPTTHFALRPFDNTGVQYGLAALNAGVITTAQFLDLNQNIGGYDNDFNYVPTRSVGDPDAIVRAQAGGLQNSASAGAAQIPIFDISGIVNDDGGYHYQWFHFAYRDRLLEAAGDTGNHVMWRGNTVPADQAWDQFIAWVSAYKADTGTGDQRSKVIADRPAGLVDGCWQDLSTFIAEPQVFGSDPASSTCNQLFPSYGFPRLVAGGPLAADIMQCTLKPIDPADYGVMLSQSEMAQLEAIFPDGVCDWSAPGQGQTVTVANGSFGPAPQHLIFDITAPAAR